MRYYGYHRVSTMEQHLDRGLASIKEFAENNGINLPDENIFTDKISGKTFDRPEYSLLKRVVKPGDVIIISEIDRLGRTKSGILKELRDLNDKQVRLMVLELPTTLMDYSKLGDSLARMMMETINNMLIEMYATFAHAEMEKRMRRQREGIESMRQRGEWERYGRPQKVKKEVFLKAYDRVKKKEVSAIQCARMLGISKASYYQYVKKYVIPE